MAWDLGDALDVVKSLADWPDVSSGKQGPARTRVGRWSIRAFLVILAVTAITLLVAWLKTPDFAAFDQAGLPIASLAVLALLILLAVHIVAAIVANAIDRRAADR